MKKPLLAAACLVLSWSISASAYTVILKDGRRVDVQPGYRLVNDVAIFTLQNGSRFSVSVRSIDISATELTNRQDSGDFVRHAGAPLPITDSDSTAPRLASKTAPNNETAKNKPRITRKLTNADFEGFKQRREEKENASNKPAGVPGGTPEPSMVPPPPPYRTTGDDRQAEAYWQGRARPLLTEMAVQEELIAVLQRQLADLESSQRRGTGYTTYQTPGGVVITRNGGYYNPGSTVILPQTGTTSEQDQERIVRTRLLDAQVQFSALQTRYYALQEEARRAGVPPGWVR
ncbi:MAG: hypothetical protein K1Y36_15850 [Blastocatellia bacterium]|nr:hypothetical protein [Blastocatellia bacterium]